MPRISVIIPSYNHEKYVAEAIQSILDQTFQDFEIVITDDGSTDATVEKIKEFKDKRIKLFCFEKNRGGAVAANNCIGNSTGEFIAVLSSDDVFFPEKLEKQVEFLDKNPSIGAVFTNLIPIDGKGKEIKDPRVFDRKYFERANRSRYDWLRFFFDGENALAHPSVLIRRECYEKVGYYNERYAQVPDWDLWIRLCMNYNIHILPQCLLKLRVFRNKANVSANRFDSRARTAWETYQMLKNFLEIKEIGEFLKIFPEAQEFKKPESGLIPFYLAMMALKRNSPSHQLFAVEVLFSILSNPKLSVRVEKKHDFNPIDLIKITGEIDMFKINESYFYKKKIREMEEEDGLNKIALIEAREISAEKEEIAVQKKQELAEKEQELHDMYHSRIIGPAIILRDRLRAFVKLSRNRLQEVESAVIRIGRKYLSEKIKRHLRFLLRQKFRIRTVMARNSKWDGVLVSVITPFYNRGDTIRETVESVLNQTFQNFEYIIVDDGSTDQESKGVFDAISHPKIRKIRQKNRGVAEARNTGIGKARGKYILCLDSDDTICTTYLEKALVILESNPEYDMVYSHIKTFGLENKIYPEPNFDPKQLYKGNIMTTATVFRREAWEKTGGYKPKIGYEDWELWINMVERGSCGRLLPEPIFNYRVAGESRYTGDLRKDKENSRIIRKLHPRYFENLRKHSRKFTQARYVWQDESQFINLDNAIHYRTTSARGKKNVLILLNWLTFGGAETVVYNFCTKLKNDYSISYITGLKSNNEWEYKFKEISDCIYHLPNIFSDENEYEKFVVNYVKTRSIDIVHIIHSGVFFPMLENLKKKFPKLKIVNTVFNTKADHFWKAIKVRNHIDRFTTDNSKVVPFFENNFPGSSAIKVIPNGIDCWKKFNYIRFDRDVERNKLSLAGNELAVYFIGRLSEEKGVDIFLQAAKSVLRCGRSKVKFFVIGDGPMKRRMLRQIRNMGRRKVKYLGYQQDIPRFLSTADIFVLSSRVEGFPLSNIEAMSMRVCVVAADVGGVSDAVKNGKTGFSVPAENSQAIADKIMMLANNKELMEKVAEQGRRSVEKNFSIEAMADQYRKIYEE